MSRHSLSIAPAGLISVDGIMAKKADVFCNAAGVVTGFAMSGHKSTGNNPSTSVRLKLPSFLLSCQENSCRVGREVFQSVTGGC